MGKPVKLKKMENATEFIIAGASSIGVLISGGLAAIIGQAKKNTSFNERIKQCEEAAEFSEKIPVIESRLEAMEEEKETIKLIQKQLTEIQINNAEYFAILQNNQKHLESVAKSVSRIHNRLDNAMKEGSYVGD